MLNSECSKVKLVSSKSLSDECKDDLSLLIYYSGE